VRPYKRVADAVRSFRGVDGDDLRMLVAGQLRDERDRHELEELAAEDPRVVLELRWIADEEVNGFHRASDVVVLNYPEVFSSGALLLAWSLGRPVVAPEGGTVTELADHGPIETFAPGGLAGALERARTRWPTPAEGEALAAAGRFGWDEMAAALRELYEVRR
jgi:glycosyltransferase involved in cell wall biosynthesis